MARVDLAVQKVSAAGVAQQAAVVGIADGHMFVNDGTVFARVENISGASPRTVTFQTSKQVDGLALADQAVVIPLSSVYIAGPFKTDTFNALAGDDAGKVLIDYENGSESDLKVELYSV